MLEQQVMTMIQHYEKKNKKIFLMTKYFLNDKIMKFFTEFFPY